MSAGVRGGTADALARLRAEPGSVAYLGASVTFQPDGYRPRLHRALDAATGHDHVAVNAGLPGGGSIVGLFLLDRFVLRHRPVLCVIEFLPTDTIGRTPEHLLPDVLRTIVGRLRAVGCAPLFLLLGRWDVDPADRQRTVAIYEDVATELGVDSIDLVSHVEGLDQQVFDATLSDEVHLTPSGADLVAAAASAALATLAEAVPAPAPPSPSTTLDSAELVQATLDDVEHPGRARWRSFRLAMDCVEIGPDTAVRLPAVDVLGLVFIAGPGTGLIRVADAEGPFELDLWDRWCYYERVAAVVFPRPARAGATVTVAGRSARAPDTDDRDPRLTLVGFMAVP